MNFNDMPCDIMKKIMNINKNEEMNEAFKNSHQTYFNNVLNELKNNNTNKPIDQLDLRNITLNILRLNRSDLYNIILNGQGCETPEDRLLFEKAIVLNLNKTPRHWIYHSLNKLNSDSGIYDYYYS